MSKSFYEPGDINITRVALSKLSSGAQIEVDIKPQILSMSIYEDIEEPTMMLEIDLIDSINLVQDFPIVGEEMITISINTPGRENPTRKGFFVYSIEGTGVHPTGKGSTYTIKAVTPLHYFNASSLIEKSYNTTIDEIVKDIIKICASRSPTEKVNAFVEKTKGLTPITIPGLTPFAAIDMLRQKAISADFPSGGAFVFFENQYGLQFKSIEGLMKDGKSTIASKSFTYAPDTNSDTARQQYAFRNILRYSHLGKFDSIEKIGGGVVSSAVESFDILTKQTEITEFKLADKARQFTSTDKKSSLPNSSSFIEKYTNATSKKFYVSKDSSKGNDFVDVNMSIKNAFASLLNQNSVRIMVNGDTYLSAGDLIELTLPEVSGTTEKKTKDRLNSGNYIITKLRHIITVEEGNKPKHLITMDCARMGYKQ
jgi:hypothetical protein